MSTQKNKLLIVDDDNAYCDALARSMERRGFDVFKAYNISEALEQASGNSPAFAIVDLRIGQESGLTLVKELVNLQPEIRIVLLTGYASIATAVEAIKLGAIHYLTKPTDPDEIIAAFTNREGNTQTPPADQPMSVERVEWEHIQMVLTEHDGNISASARALGMHRRTLQRKLSKHPRRH